jgi:6-phosphogluconolactonase
MGGMSSEARRIYADADALAHAAGVELRRIADESIAARGVFTLALSGGSTPKRLYSLLANDAAFREFPWPSTQLFFGDERHVPPTHPDSNYLMTKNSLLTTGRVPEENLHRVQAENPDADEAARQYEVELRNFFTGERALHGLPRFDAVLLGMGPDGHTASLFPGSAGLEEQRRWVIANWVEKFKSHRITFTYPVLNSARNVLLLIAGADKADMLHEVLVSRRDEAIYPVQKLELIEGHKTWMLDDAAAAKLPAAPGRKPTQIAPSIIASDFSYLRGEIARVNQSGADMLHVDIMDGHFVPNITFGPAITATMRQISKVPLDVHLMISHPRQYITPFVEAGASNLTIHVESEDNIRVALEEILYYSRKAGLAVKPKTPLSAVQDYLGIIDRLLIMTVEPGFGGQKFMRDMMPKVEEAVRLRAEGGFKYDIQVDGGLDKFTIWEAVRAGAEVIVAGTAVFKHMDLTHAVWDLRDNARQALDYLNQPPTPPEG